VSQLKTEIEEAGFSAEVLYLNLRFAERLGPHTDDWICSGTTDVMLGEFIFSQVLFRRPEEHLEAYVRDVLAESDAGRELSQLIPKESLLGALKRFVSEASKFSGKEAINEILTRDPWMVGMTSSFQQNCASLALIKQIKRQRPDILTVMGGANCESVMGEELFAQFPEVDFVGQGECDHSFVDLIRSIRQSNPGQAVPGILARANSQTPAAPRPLTGEDMDRLPYPDFTDYFAELSTIQFRDSISPGLVMESSRGCWWGAKSQCAFCGMNGGNMGFRKKSAARILEELDALVKKYMVPRIFMADNILDSRSFKTLLPHLADHPVAELFYETKPTFSREQVGMLARSNIRWIQPGIESLSDRTLKLMRKGTTALKNIQLLKWCTELGIRVTWNHLFGVPGESEEDVKEIAKTAEAIHHLEPPKSVGVLHLDRFSPHFISSAEYGLEPISPIKPYSYIYPFSIESLKRMAYFYQSELFTQKSKSEAYERLRKIVAVWRRVHVRSHLIAIPSNRSLHIIDTRTCSHRFWHRLTGLSRRVYEYCDRAHSLQAILTALGDGVNQSQVESILETFVQARLMLQINGRYLSLATDFRHSYRRFIGVFPGGQLRGQGIVDQFGRVFFGVIKRRIPVWLIVNGLIMRASRVWGSFIPNVLMRVVRPPDQTPAGRERGRIGQF
jgi:magnesium-protoporphyrin IX monomethyl ester (oxidative) cyclase